MKILLPLRFMATSRWQGNAMNCHSSCMPLSESAGCRSADHSLLCPECDQAICLGCSKIPWDQADLDCCSPTPDLIQLY